MTSISSKREGLIADDGEAEPSSKPLADVYFSADVETDGPIPGPYSMLSFALVYAGRYDGATFERSTFAKREIFYCELRPISDEFQVEALEVNGLDRERLKVEGASPSDAMRSASDFVRKVTGERGRPVLVAYPVSFDWTWLYWYFVKFCGESPFRHSDCFDLKTAYAVKAREPIARSGRTRILRELRSDRPHSHNALDDAFEQAEIFANLFEWGGLPGGRAPRAAKSDR